LLGALVVAPAVAVEPAEEFAGGVSAAGKNWRD
jgi:hypothetical protein